MSKIFIFHYHLLPGGVTSVITESVKALATQGRIPKKITIVSGRRENTEKIRSDILSQIDSKINFSIETVPQIDYLDMKTKPSQERVKELAELLINRYSAKDSIWLVHNYNLGKNPIFTEALLRIAETKTEQRIIFQIHDFPESGRYEYLAFLKKFLNHSPYPVSENVRYAVINTRDRKILVDSGIPEEYVFLLENPFQSDKIYFNNSHSDKLKKQIFSYYGIDYGINYYELPKLILYPIRAIRRKNVFESAFLTRLLSQNFQLAITLPGTSQTEKAYSRKVEEAFRKGLIKGIWKVGQELDKIGITFEELITASDMLLSTSVQEGFGFSYIQSIIWNKPLGARYLDILEGFKKIFSDHPVRFYSKLYCPLDLKSRKFLREAYKIKINGLKEILSESSLDRLHSEADKLTDSELVDYSFLDTQSQIDILSRLADKTFMETVETINLDLLDNFRNIMDRKLSREEHENKIDMINNRFGYEAYAGKFHTIEESFYQKPRRHNMKNIQNRSEIWSKIIDNFAKIDYLRLIYG